jgi:hypothetical protein
MNCQQIDKYIYEFCDKQLAPQMHDRIQRHLDECENCRNKVESAHREGMLLRSLPIVPALQPQFTDDIMAAVRGRCANTRPGLLPGRRSRYPRKLRWWWGVTSAAVLILALGSLSLLEKPLGTKLADQNTDIIVKSDVLYAPSKSIPVETTQTTAPQGNQIKESATEQLQQATVQDSYQNNNTYQNDAYRMDAARSAPVAHQFSTVAVTDGATKSALMSNPNRGVDLLTLYPANLPPDYLLQSIISPSDQEITFVYENQTTDHKLMLTVVNVPLATDEHAGTGEESPLMKDATITPPGEAEPERAVSPQVDNKPSNSVQRTLDHNQQPYQVMLSAEISTEELASIADAITLEEGIHRAQPANP